MDVASIFDSIARKLEIDFDYLSSQVEHRQSKGRIRELEIVEEFFRLYMPQTVGIGHGEIVATTGDVSNEADIVFYQAHGCPTLIEKSGYQVFPCECVHGLVEVKSHLDGTELRDAFKKITRIKQFPKSAFEAQTGAIHHSSNLYGKEWGFFPTIGIVFAYDSMNLATVCDQLTDLQSDVPIHQRIDLVVVLRKGLVINWEDDDKVLCHTPTPSSRLRAVESTNPLLLTVVFLQQLFQSAWMPRFNIREYMPQVDYGRFLDE